MQQLRNRIEQIQAKIDALEEEQGVVASSLTKGLKSIAKSVGNGLQELDKKIGSILPGLLGVIVSFVFRTAGQVISLLPLLVL